VIDGPPDGGWPSTLGAQASRLLFVPEGPENPTVGLNPGQKTLARGSRAPRDRGKTGPSTPFPVSLRPFKNCGAPGLDGLKRAICGRNALPLPGDRSSEDQSKCSSFREIDAAYGERFLGATLGYERPFPGVSTSRVATTLDELPFSDRIRGAGSVSPSGSGTWKERGLWLYERSVLGGYDALEESFGCASRPHYNVSRITVSRRPSCVHS